MSFAPIGNPQLREAISGRKIRERPYAPLYKLGVICGVTSQTNYRYTSVCHANFLASLDGGLSWELFFAEFWNQADNRIEEPKKSFCCPIPDDHKYPGRCVVCENDSSVIIHPQSGKYYMGHSGLLPQLVNLVADTEELDFDVIYSSEGGGGVCGPATGGENERPASHVKATNQCP